MPDPIKGRGTSANPRNRFVRLEVIPDAEHAAPGDEAPLPRTEFFRDSSRTILARNQSPDIPFEVSLNPFRGCEHGCIYCFARCFHEWLDFSAGLDFETKIMVKADAPELLREELSSPKWRPQVVAIGTATDAYQPVESRLRLTRRCIEVFREFANPISVVTKNYLVTRDADILGEMASDNLAIAHVSLTTLDTDVARVMEPRTSAPQRRLDAIRKLSAAGVPVTVLVSPIIPGLTDHEVPALLQAAADAGATSAGYQIVRLPQAVGPLFEQWLAQHFPDRKDKVLHRIRAMRGGQLNRAQFHERMKCEGPFADQIHQIFTLAKRRFGLDDPHPELTTTRFHRPGQLNLFTELSNPNRQVP